MTDRVYHYCLGPEIVLEVIETGVLSPPEGDLLWFSPDPRYQPTRGVLEYDDPRGGMRIPGLRELAENLKAYRFSLPADDGRLQPMADVYKAMGIPRAERRRMLSRARKHGADLSSWLGIDGVVPIEELVCDIFMDDGWRRMMSGRVFASWVVDEELDDPDEQRGRYVAEIR